MQSFLFVHLIVLCDRNLYLYHAVLELGLGKSYGGGEGSFYNIDLLKILIGRYQ